MTPEQQPVSGAVITTTPQAQPSRAPVALREMMEILKAADAAAVRALASQIVEREVAAALFDQDTRLATSFALSGLFDNLRNVPRDEGICRAMTFVQLGRSWGMTPGDSMQYIEFQQGKPSIRNEYLAARMRDDGLSWDFDWHRDEKGECIGCTLLLKRRQADGSYAALMERVNGVEVQASVTFTKTDAQRVPSRENGQSITLDQKSTYMAYAEDMYYWKCIARVKRRYCTNILSGIPMGDEPTAVEEDAPVRAAPPPPRPMVAERKPKPAPQSDDDLVPALEESLRIQERKSLF